MRAKKNKGLIFVISGPSGSGKTTLVKRLLKTEGLKNKLVKSVSFATRAKRSGEKSKIDYFFISEKDFLKKLKIKEILEHTRYLGYYYGTPREFVEGQLRKGKHILLCLDFKGALRIRRNYPDKTKTIFVLPPSFKALRNRIAKRCRKTKNEEIEKRLNLATKELRQAKHYNYCLVNRDLDKTTEKLRKIILKEISN